MCIFILSISFQGVYTFKFIFILQKKKGNFCDFIKGYPQVLNEENGNNGNNNANIDKIIEENNKLKIDLEQKNNEIQKLKTDINNNFNEINNLKNEIQRLNKDLNEQINENQNLKNLNHELSNKIKLSECNKNLNQNINNNLINNQNIFDKKKIAICIEDFIPVIFQSQDKKKTYSIICRKNDKFIDVEKSLYERFPEIEENENYEFSYTINGRKIKRKTKTLNEHNINYSDIVIIN